MPAPKRRTPASSIHRSRSGSSTVKPSPKTEDDFTFDHAAATDAVARAPPIPPSKDLRAAWWKINDQGSTGSCVGWGTADGLLRWHFVQAGRVKNNELLVAALHLDGVQGDRPDTYPADDSSSRRRARASSRRSTSPASSAPCATPSCPSPPGALYDGDSKTFYALASQLKILTYFNLGTTLGNWKTWLATKGPILTRLDVDATWDAATDNKGNMDEYQPDTTRGGHCVALVGYRKDRFIVRNSWGTGWGDNGFGYASLAYAQAAFTEAYGIQV